MKIIGATREWVDIRLTESEAREVRAALGRSNDEDLRWEFTKAVASIMSERFDQSLREGEK